MLFFLIFKLEEVILKNVIKLLVLSLSLVSAAYGTQHEDLRNEMVNEMRNKITELDLRDSAHEKYSSEQNRDSLLLIESENTRAKYPNLQSITMSKHREVISPIDIESLRQYYPNLEIITDIVRIF